MKVSRKGIEPATCQWQVQRPTTTPPDLEYKSEMMLSECATGRSDVNRTTVINQLDSKST